MSVYNLISEIENGKIIKEGVLSIYSDTIGKPGDRILTLNKIELLENNELQFFFGKDEIVRILNPMNMEFNNKIIVINSTRILWKSNNFEFEYRVMNSEIIPSLINGDHVFRTKKGTPAFEFSSW